MDEILTIWKKELCNLIAKEFGKDSIINLQENLGFLYYEVKIYMIKMTIFKNAILILKYNIYYWHGSG